MLKVQKADQPEIDVNSADLAGFVVDHTVGVFTCLPFSTEKKEVIKK